MTLIRMNLQTASTRVSELNFLGRAVKILHSIKKNNSLAHESFKE
jgi:hypothetical protein